MYELFIVLYLLVALALIVLVLIQHGKGADMGAAFGSGASGSVFGATGSANFLSRATAIAAAAFFVTTLMLAFVVGTWESLDLERNAKGRTKLIKTWRLCFWVATVTKTVMPRAAPR